MTKAATRDRSGGGAYSKQWRLDFIAKHGRETYLEMKKVAQRNNRLKIEYGITLEQKTAMWESQDRKCANIFCGRPLDNPQTTNRKTSSKANVDHDHKTNKVRALLCTGCNASLGHCGDDRHRISGLVDYLNRFQGVIYA